MEKASLPTSTLYVSDLTASVGEVRQPHQQLLRQLSLRRGSEFEGFKYGFSEKNF